MNIDILVYAALGGLVPDAIRTLKWARTAKAKRGVNPLTDGAIYVAVSIQVVLALLAAGLLVVTTPLQAMAVGYAAPDILVRVFTTVSKSSVVKMGAATAPTPSLPNRVVAWLRT